MSYHISSIIESSLALPSKSFLTYAWWVSIFASAIESLSSCSTTLLITFFISLRSFFFNKSSTLDRCLSRLFFPLNISGNLSFTTYLRSKSSSFSVDSPSETTEIRSGSFIILSSINLPCTHFQISLIEYSWTLWGLT